MLGPVAAFCLCVFKVLPEYIIGLKRSLFFFFVLNPAVVEFDSLIAYERYL